MRVSVLSFCLFLACVSGAQPVLEWNKTLGSTNWDDLQTVLPVDDGKQFLVGGNLAAERVGSSQVAYGANDYFIMLTTAEGEPIWEKRFGGSGNDHLWNVIELGNGDFLLGGSSDSDVSGTKQMGGFGGDDYWLIRVDQNGNQLWEMTYGGAGEDELFDMAENADGTLLLVGFSDSGISGNKTLAALGGTDGWVLHVDELGNLLDQHLFGTDSYDNLYTITKHPTGGYLVSGAVSGEKSATVSQAGRGKTDIYIAKIDETGKYEWDTRLGGSSDEQIYAVKQSQYGGFLVCGGSSSGVSIDKSDPNRGGYDYWLIKISANGQKLWDVSYGETGLDVAYDLVEMPDGNIYLAGVSDSPKGNLKQSDALGSYDYWLCYLDTEGNKLWDKTYGGSGSDALTQLVLTPNYGLILAGHSASDVSFDKTDSSLGFNDIWLVRTRCDAELNVPSEVSHCIGTPLEVVPVSSFCPEPDCQIVWNRRKATNATSGFVPTQTGELEMILRDRNGCIALDTIQLFQDSTFQVDLGQDTVVLFGQAVSVTAEHNWPGLVTFQWQNGLKDQTLSANEEKLYTVTVTNEVGCTATDQVFVCDCAHYLVYLANVFQPNNNLNNDVWFVQSQAGAVDQVNRVLISDSWGTIVFSSEDTEPNNRDAGWNGTFHGKTCLPGVYTYLVELTYANQKKEVIFGTVTLVN